MAARPPNNTQGTISQETRRMLWGDVPLSHHHSEDHDDFAPGLGFRPSHLSINETNRDRSVNVPFTRREQLAMKGS